MVGAKVDIWKFDVHLHFGNSHVWKTYIVLLKSIYSWTGFSLLCSEKAKVKSNYVLFCLLCKELINLPECRAPLAATKCQASNFCMNFSSKSAFGNLLPSDYPAGTFFSDLCLQAQGTFNEA